MDLVDNASEILKLGAAAAKSRFVPSL